MKDVTFKCRNCGIEKTRRISNNMPMPKFCSHRCANFWNHSHHIGVKGSKPPVQFKCIEPTCGVTFERRAPMGVMRFCSPECRKKFVQRAIEKRVLEMGL